MATKTKAEVDSMDKRERLYDSLSYSYGKKGEKIAKEFDKARSQSDRQLLSRGMQRSSYGAQTLVGLDRAKIDALNDNESEMIADYENRLSDIEKQEQDQANWQAQFDESRRQYDTTLAYNKEQAELGRQFNREEREAQRAWQSGENALSRAFQTSEREATQKYNTSEREAQQSWQSSENALTRAHQTSEREATQKYNTSEREASQRWQSSENALNRAYQTSEREASQRWQSSENALNRAHQTSEREATQRYNTSEREAKQAWQSGENALNRAQNQSQFEANLSYQRERDAQSQQNWEIKQAFQERQWETQQAQWREQFDYNSMTNDQQIAYNYVVQAAANGGDVSDELLNRAGLSRSDYNAMKTGAQATGGGGGSRRSGGGGDDNPGSSTPPPASDADVDAVFDEEEPGGTGTAKGMNGLTKKEFELGNNLSSGKANVDHELSSNFSSKLESLGYGSTPIVIDPVNGSTVEVEEIDPVEQAYLEGLKNKNKSPKNNNSKANKKLNNTNTALTK